MSFIIECPHCQEKLEAQDEWTGMEVQCPFCKKSMVLQKPEVANLNDENKENGDSGKKGGKGKKDDEFGCIGWSILLAVLGGILWGCWWLLTTFPKTCFWIIAPIASLCILFGIGFKGALKYLTICLMIGIIGWGIWANSSGYGSDPKGVVQAFISACEHGNYEKAAKMFYSTYSGKCLSKDDDSFPYIGGKESKGYLSAQSTYYLSDGKHVLGPVHIGYTIGTEKYYPSPREVIYDSKNPNRCTVLVFGERNEKYFVCDNVRAKAYGQKKTIYDDCKYVKSECSWNLEKIDGRWMITYIEHVKRYHIHEGFGD